MTASRQVDQTLEKSMTVLETVARMKEPCGVTEIADMLGLTRSNAHRILKGLVVLGYLRPSPAKRGHYELTIKLWEIGSHFFSKLDIRRICAPYMTRVAEATRETVLLSVLDGSEVLFLAAIESPQAVRAYTAVGQRAPTHCVASGLVQLAWADDAAVNLVKMTLTRFTPHTITEPAALDERLAMIRHDGYAITECEWVDNANAFAAPILDATGKVIAGIAVTGPFNRLDHEACIAHSASLIETSRSISAHLGWQF